MGENILDAYCTEVCTTNGTHENSPRLADQPRIHADAEFRPYDCGEEKGKTFHGASSLADLHRNLHTDMNDSNG